MHSTINLQGLGLEFNSTDNWFCLTSKYVFISPGLHTLYVFDICFCLFAVSFQLKWNVIIFKPVWSLWVVSSKLASLRTFVVLAMFGEFLLLMRKKKSQSCHFHPLRGHKKGNDLKHYCLISLRNVKGKKSTAVRRACWLDKEPCGFCGWTSHTWMDLNNKSNKAFIQDPMLDIFISSILNPQRRQQNLFLVFNSV